MARKVTITASAVIRVSVEIPAPGAYGEDWTLDKVHEQAEREAIASLRGAIEKIHGRVFSDTAVVKVITKRERD